MELKEKDKKTLIGLGAVVVIAILYLAFTDWIPKYNKINLDIEEKRKQINEATEQNKLLNKMRYEISVLDNELQQLKRFFPEEEPNNKKTLELLTKMEMLGNKLGISFGSLTFAAPMEYEGGLYKEVPMSLALSKPIKSETLVKLLYAFDRYENILDVKQFNFTPFDDKKELFNVQLTVSFFMFRADAFKI